MKHFFACLLGLGLLASAAQAQTPAPDPVRAKLDNIFANLDKSQVPTGCLLEAAVPLGPVAIFDGTLRDSARADMSVFRHLFATALSSRLAGTEPLPDVPTFNQRVLAAAPATAASPIPIAVQYIRYATLRPDAETAGLVTLQNEQLYDVSGRSQSPYQTAVLFAAAPERTYSTTSTVSLVLPGQLRLASGEPAANPALYLDFADGAGYRTATWDQPLSTTYATSGTKRVKVKMVYTVAGSSSETRESWFDLRVFATPSTAAYRSATSGGPIANAYPPTVPAGSTAGLDMLIAPTAGFPYRTDYTDHRGATVNVRYGQGHTSIVKPFIVVEQYNTTKVAPHLVGENNQENTIQTFLRSIDRDFATTGNFNDALQQAGYDLIYIDFTENLDDIRRNAALFEQVLRWVNDQKQQAGSTEKNVVMGMSMGGLIGRYGLSRLVRNGYDPQTRLLVLHDSPQRGAINPMGLQALSRQADFPVALLPGNNQGGRNTLIVRTSDLSDQLKEAAAILDAPATQQLSIKRVTGIDNEYEDNTFIDGPYKDMIDFGGNVPANFPPIIATSDGSQCGQPQDAPAYQELTRDDRSYLLGLSYVPFRTGIQSQAIANALPAYGTQNTIAHLRVWFTIRILWFKVDVTLLNRNYTSPPNTLPYETLPGGSTNLNEQQDLTTNHDNGFLGLWKFSDNTVLYNGNICFAPTYSTLDVLTVTPATIFSKYINNITNNPSPPRVGPYIAQEQSGNQFNLTHLRFTARNSEWIYDQMEGLPLASNYCSTECYSVANPAITGPLTLCVGNGGPATYTSPLQGTGYTYTWTASPCSAFTVCSGTGPTFQTANVPGVNDTGTITLTVNTGCEFSFSKRIVIGAPEEPIVVLDEQDDCNHIAYLHIDNYDPDLPYNIYGSGVGGRAGASFFVKNSAYHVSVNNGCGTATTNGTVTFGTCSGPMAGYAIYPNPATNDLTVEQTDTTGTSVARGPAARSAATTSASASASATAPSTPFTVRLYDTYGTLHVQQTATTPTLHLGVGTLPAGLYLLRIEANGAIVQSRQLQITH